MKCFYHNDADGQVSAAWVCLSAGIPDNEPVNNSSIKSDFISMDYDKRFPIEIIRKDETVWIVDFSISPDKMERLLQITKNVIWVDHHKTAIEKYKDFKHKIRGVRKSGVSGCELTFCYIHEMTERGSGVEKEFDKSMLDECPMATRYIGDRDVWEFKYGDVTRNVYAGYQNLSGIPYNNDMIEFINSDGRGLAKTGSIIEQFKKISREKTVKDFSFEIVFEGYKGLACNSTDKTSELFGDDFNNYDFCSVFTFNGKTWTVSLYSKKIDVSKIAVKYGGGGHTGAAGFVCSKVPYFK